MKLELSRLLYICVQSLMISLYFGGFNIDIGFSLKPYMIVSVITMAVFFRSWRMGRMFPFEKLMLFFIAGFSLTALQFRYSEYHLRFLFVFIVILGFYFIYRGLINRIRIETIEEMISNAGLVGVSVSILYYLLGIVSTGMNYYGNNVIHYGLILDRGVPRLIGTSTNDPNIFVLFITMYFFYTLCNSKSIKNKVGFSLAGISIILTFSRGAIVAIAIPLVLSFLIELDGKKRFKALIFVTVVSFVLLKIGQMFGIDVMGTMERRFLGMVVDGGSGRNVLWLNAWQTFLDNPLFGIGINSTLPYGRIFYGSRNYVHNTMLEVLSESGLFGIILFTLLWLSALWYSFRVFFKNSKAKYVFLTFVAMFFQMLILSVLYNEAFYFSLLILQRYTSEYLIKQRTFAHYSVNPK